MKKIFFIVSIIFVVSAFFLGCKKTKQDIIVWRHISPKNMVNGYGAYHFILADPDSVLYSGIHVARLKAHIFNIPDTVEIIKFGHIWSQVNPNPTLATASVVNTSDSVSFSPGDSAITYISDLDGLQLDTGYYARSFLIFKELNSGQIDTAYNQVVTHFRTAVPKDIWFYRGVMKQGGAPLDSRTEAVVVQVYDAQNDAYKVYMGTGFNGYTLLDDFYSYDPENNTWTQVSDFQGGPRYKAVAFAIGNYIYVGTGKYNLSDTSYSGDFYKYFYPANRWIRSTGMPENTERFDAIGFSIYYNNQWWGYVGFGRRATVRSDVYIYDPTKDSDTGYVDPYRVWTLKSFGIDGRTEAVAISNGTIAFLGGGKDASGQPLNDYYLFDPNIDPNNFNKILASVPFYPRYDAVANYVEFTRDGQLHKYFFLGTGKSDDNTYYNDWYAYDLKNGVWLTKSHIHEDFLEGSPRAGAICFVVKKQQVEHGLKVRIFVGGGNYKNQILNDIWEYLP